MIYIKCMAEPLKISNKNLKTILLFIKNIEFVVILKFSNRSIHKWEHFKRIFVDWTREKKVYSLLLDTKEEPKRRILDFGDFYIIFNFHSGNVRDYVFAFMFSPFQCVAEWSEHRARWRNEQTQWQIEGQLPDMFHIKVFFYFSASSLFLLLFRSFLTPISHFNIQLETLNKHSSQL